MAACDNNRFANIIFSSASFLECATDGDVLVDAAGSAAVELPRVTAIPACSSFTLGANIVADGVLTVPDEGMDRAVVAVINVGIAAACGEGGAAAIDRAFGAINVGLGEAAVVDVIAPAVIPNGWADNGLPIELEDDVGPIAAPGSGFTALKAPYKEKKKHQQHKTTQRQSHTYKTPALNAIKTCRRFGRKRPRKVHFLNHAGKNGIACNALDNVHNRLDIIAISFSHFRVQCRILFHGQHLLQECKHLLEHLLAGTWCLLLHGRRWFH